MYAIKPWANVLLIGNTIESCAMGIGMRWRESNATIIEKKPNAHYEFDRYRRCVLTEQSVKLLVDLGCTAKKLHSVLRPAKGWRFLSPELSVLREGTTFPGCALGESVYHCTEGSLLRVLRTEFLRFGGTVVWGTEAFDAYESSDGSETWCLRKEYGMGAGAEAIITTAASTSLASLIIAEDPERIAVKFHVTHGVGRLDGSCRKRVFGDGADVAIVVGCGMALHCWMVGTGSLCSWRLVRTSNDSLSGPSLLGLDRSLHDMMSDSEGTQSSMCVIPGTTPAIKDSAIHAKVGVLGNALLPVDPFEWRGDCARCALEEASALCRAFYGKKYHRGSASFLLRGAEQDCIAKRANLLQRDLKDAEHFLSAQPRLAREQEEPRMPRFSEG